MEWSGTAWDSVPEDRRWFLGGAFDGDGCVLASGGRLRMCMTQAARGRPLLDLFSEVLGGRVYDRTPTQPRETHQPTAVWYLNGPAARVACGHLAPYTHLKRRQLDVAHTTTPAAAAATILADLKRVPHDPIRERLHVAYAAGIVDTDGSMRVFPYIRLSVAQKYPAVVHALRETFDAGGVCQETPAAFRWQVYGRNAKAIIEMLQPHFVAKRPQADIVLLAKLTRDTDAHVQLMAYQGNQGAKAGDGIAHNKLAILPTRLRQRK